jgi:DNA repair protein RecO (recombination protein O)
MSIIKTEAIVLKSDNYRHTSRLVTFFTKEHGKLRCIAKGVRDTKSRWGGVLQPMCCLNIILYYKENKTLHLVSNAEHSRLLMNLYNDIEKMKLGYRMIELVNRTAEEQHANQNVFELLKNSLSLLNAADSKTENVFIAFEFKLAHLLGIGINANLLNSKLFNYHARGPEGEETVREKSAEKAYSRDLANTLDSLKDWNFNMLSDFNISRDVLAFLYDFFDGYFSSHFDNLSSPKTKRVFQKN